MRLYDHNSVLRAGVVLVNLGTPACADVPAIRRWLGQFLSDRRVIEIPRVLWWPILYGIILRVRPKKLAEKYRSILIDGALPLRVHTEALAVALEQSLQSAWGADKPGPLVRSAMTYGEPTIGQVIDEMGDQGVTRFLIVPMYPQYSATTTAPVFDQCFAHLRARRFVPEIHIVSSYHRHPAYIDGLARSVRAHWQEHGRGDHLLMSFHGLPQRNVRLGDPYLCHSHVSARLLSSSLELAADDYSLSFQSRFGAQKWLQPYTSDRIEALGRAGVKKLDVICPGFACDCLETLEEIAMEGQEIFQRNGGSSLHLIPCFNATEYGVRLYTEMALAHSSWLDSESADPAMLSTRLQNYHQSCHDQNLPAPNDTAD